MTEVVKIKLVILIGFIIQSVYLTQFVTKHMTEVTKDIEHHQYILDTVLHRLERCEEICK